MIKTTLTAFSLATFTIFTAVNDFQKQIPQPVQITEEIGRTTARYALEELGAPKDKIETLTRSAYAAGIGTEIDPVLIVVLMYTESRFKVTARSNKNYKGLMQTSSAGMRWDLAEADTFKGGCILREKLKTQYANGDTLKALQLYKGGKNNEAMKYAKETHDLYKKIKVNERIKMEDKTNG